MWNVYIIASRPKQPIKVGLTSGLDARLLSLQNGFFNKLYVFKKWQMNMEDAYYLEGVAHSHLKKYEMRGEWFSCSPEHAAKTINKILKEKKNCGGWQSYREITGKIKVGHHGTNASVRARTAVSEEKAEKIKKRWKLPHSQWSTAKLLREADISYNTAKRILGARNK